MKRRFFFHRIEQLEALADNPNTSETCLKSIAEELTHRSTWRAQKLAKKLRDRHRGSEEKQRATFANITTDAGPALGVKLSTIPLSTRSKNVLEAHNIVVAADLCRLSEAQLLRFPNAGRKTVNELRGVLKSLGLHFGIDSTSAVEPSTQSAQFALPVEFRVEEPDDLPGALRAHVAASERSERNARWVIEHFGWNGEPRRTLEAIGSADGVTRERVRQIAAKCSTRLREREITPRALERTLHLLEQKSPLTQSAFDEVLRECGLASNGFDIRGLKTAASAFGLPFPYALVEGTDSLIIPEELAELPAAMLRVAKMEVSAHGAIVDDQLVEICKNISSRPVALGFIHAILHNDGTFVPLRDCKDWWWRPTLARRGWNRLVNTVAKVLAACPAISFGELRDACRRHVRTNHIAPPTRVLRAVCSSLPFARVCDNHIERVANALDWESVLSPFERLLLRVFEDHGPILDSYNFTQEGIALGLNENSLNVYKSYSPILWSPVPGYYSIVGSDIPVGLIDDLRRRKGRTSTLKPQFGWSADHRMLLARQINEGMWLSGIVNVPSAVHDIIQGEFSLFALGSLQLGDVCLKEASTFGLRPFMRMFGAEVGDFIVMAFDPRTKRCDCWLGGNELGRVAQLGPDAMLSYLSRNQEPETLD